MRHDNSQFMYLIMLHAHEWSMLHVTFHVKYGAQI
jgi:hypothetical protein